MAMPDEALVYVVDDDQGMLESTVWLLESVGLKHGEWNDTLLMQRPLGAGNATVPHPDELRQ